MARINLLPWRAERRKQRQREFYTMLGLAAVAGVLMSLLLYFYYDGQVSGQNERNAYLEAEIAKVKEQNKEIDRLDSQKKRLLDRKQVIEELQGKRSQMVHLFDALVRTIPDGVVLTALKQEGETLTLEGRTQSNARVSTYMRNLESSGWMSNPELSVIEAKAQEASDSAVDIKSLPYVFTLKVKLPAPGENAAQGNVAPNADAAAPAATPAAAADPAAPAPAAPAPAADTAQKEARP
ncbi:PilN domain-containing protein [Stenotrophomonas acidaminiphila]|uniref:PilN domain-containing protein n=2 Tax=Stenotrophomonas acidaminiphila TaxID=128780 RepID=UPI001375514C|nr:PilN domain-containing protein [Stenotrophomonas acidaminiphila]NCT88388.1 PilN domain-containing protein [Stenotrophomonas acidaminiphila]